MLAALAAHRRGRGMLSPPSKEGVQGHRGPVSNDPAVPGALVWGQVCVHQVTRFFTG